VQVRFTRFAHQELIDTIEYYDLHVVGLGSRFKESVGLGIKRIKNNPLAWEKYSDSTRKYTMGKFPYIIIYILENDIITIIAIANSHRKPNYWVEEGRQ